jgi:hypoxanthine phosphoribosyltransferase
MVKKVYYSWQDVEKMCVNIVTQMYKDNWKPDYIVGITRGGNVPATIISNMLDVRCEALKVSLRDDTLGPESNCWMAEDAFGYVGVDEDRVPNDGLDKQMLIVDDINDTGATFNWIKEDWPGLCLPNDPKWDTVWGNNVRFAVLTENLSSDFDGVSYYCDEVNKAEEDVWLVYPWENVGHYG